MRKKSKGRKVQRKLKQDTEKGADQDAESIVFIDENSKGVQVRTGKSSTDHESSGEDEIELKDDNERVIAVIDKSPANSKSNEEKVEAADQEDDAPEDVSWKASKESALRERTLEKEIILDAKRKEKQTRIERNEKLREQKERKRAREYSRLPMEVLQKVAKQQESEKTLKSQTIDTGSHVTFDSSSEDEQEEQEEEGLAVDEELPEIKVVVLPRETKKPKKVQQSASLFLQEHLFGDRIQRISASKNSDRTRKYKALVPALKFSKKSW